MVVMDPERDMYKQIETIASDYLLSHKYRTGP